MPLYIGDYLGDTMHLSTLEHGAYLLLLMAYWKNRGPLDEKTIPLICRMSLSDFAAIRSAIEPFFQITGNSWRNRRADAEIEKWALFKDEKEFGAAITNFKKRGIPIPERFAERYAERYGQPTLSDTPPPSPLSTEEKEIREDSHFEEFKKIARSYPGRVNGAENEFKNFKAKYPKEWKSILPKLGPGIEREKEWRARAAEIPGHFLPGWAHLQTWINQGRWDQLLEALPKRDKASFVGQL